MRRFSISLAVLLFVVCAAGTYAANSPTIVMPSQLKWSTAAVPKGMSMAVVSGNPNGTGWYVVRIKMSPGSKFPVHVHSGDERVTVLQGTLLAGIGPKWNTAAMKPLPVGTYVVMPAGVPHYVMAQGDVIVDVSGQGPMTTKMLGSGGGNTSM